MTLSEFKAWFEGYTEGMEGPPTAAQFDRIKERLKETAIITKVSTPAPFVFDEFPPARVIFSTMTSLIADNTVVCNANDGNKTFGASGIDVKRAIDLGRPFDAHAAMYALGKAEANAA